MKLTDRFADELHLPDRTLTLNMAFDNVLRSMELWKDKEFTEAEKVEIFLHMFLENDYEQIEDYSGSQRVQLIHAILDNFVVEKSENETGKTQDGKGGNKKPVYDVEKDAEYIYASFLYDYNIDLFEEQGHLHWRKFQALLINLSDKSKFKQVVNIRTSKIPRPNKHNKEERERMIKMKRIYSLENQERSVDEIDAKFDHLATMLRPDRKSKPEAGEQDE